MTRKHMACSYGRLSGSGYLLGACDGRGRYMGGAGVLVCETNMESDPGV